MDPESKKLLEETLALTRENNSMLHSMKRSMVMARAMTIFYWLFIIGSAIAAYYFIQPYFSRLMNVYGGASSILK